MADAAAAEAAGKAYCIAWFNEQGRVSIFEKRFHGKTFFRVEYFYKDGNIIKAQGIDADGKTDVQNY